MNEALIFKLNDIAEAAIGTSRLYSVDSPITLEGIDNKSNLKCGVEVMKIENGFNGKISDLKLPVELPCERCLESAEHEVSIPHAERQFLLEAPKEIDDQLDIYLVDKKHLQIDLSEMLRQEIILHFPVIQVCSESCLGICPNCGTDRNEKDCNCTGEIKQPRANTPLAALKELLK